MKKKHKDKLKNCFINQDGRFINGFMIKDLKKMGRKRQKRYRFTLEKSQPTFSDIKKTKSTMIFIYKVNQDF